MGCNHKGAGPLRVKSGLSRVSVDASPSLSSGALAELKERLEES